MRDCDGTNAATAGEDGNDPIDPHATETQESQAPPPTADKNDDGCNSMA